MSNEFLGERRKGLEEAYFAKHNRELIARLRKGHASPHEGPSAPHDSLVDEARSLPGEARPILTLRSIRPEDRVRYEAFLQRVDAADLKFRFGRSFEDLAPEERARLICPDQEREVAFIVTAQLEGGSSEIVGEVRARADEYGERSEFAIVVRSDFQRLGVGRALLEELIAHCSAEGGHLLYGLVDPANVGMLALARRLGFEIDHVPGGVTVVVSLDLRSLQGRSRHAAKAHRPTLRADLWAA